MQIENLESPYIPIVKTRGFTAKFDKKLVVIDPDEALSYRTPLAVTEYILLKADGMYPVCPRCGISMEREYMNFCDRCGQKLDWRRFSRATEKRLPLKNA